MGATRNDTDGPGGFSDDLVEEPGREGAGDGGPDEPAAGFESAETVGQEGLWGGGGRVDVFDNFEEGDHVELGVVRRGDGGGFGWCCCG